MNPNSGVLNTILHAFLTQLSPGQLLGDALSLFKILVAIEITFLGLWWAISGGEIVGKILKKVLFIGFFSYVLNKYPEILSWVVTGFTEIGSKAAGGGLPPINDPSGVVDAGVNLVEPLLELASEKISLLSGDILDGLFIFVTVLVTMAAFAILAFQILITRIEFAMISTLGLILIPFGIFKHTSFLAEKVFGAIVSFGVKLMVLSFVVSIAYPIMLQLSLVRAEYSFFDQIYAMVGSFSVTILALHAPGTAAGLLSGSPSLNIGSAVSAAALGTGAGGLLVSGAGAALAARDGKKAGTSATIKAAGAVEGSTKSTDGGSGGGSSSSSTPSDAMQSSGMSSGGASLPPKPSPLQIGMQSGGSSGNKSYSSSISAERQRSNFGREDFQSASSDTIESNPATSDDNSKDGTKGSGQNQSQEKFPDNSKGKERSSVLSKVMNGHQIASSVLDKTATPNGALQVPLQGESD